jgi:4-hydroxybenzoate polyprenyltransferase
LSSLAFVLAGATFLYLAGAFLSDAFDASSDRERRRTRPIPSGQVQESAVFRWGWVWFVLGIASLFWAGRASGFWGLALALCVVAFSAVHRLLTLSPVLLSLCRFLIYPIAASAGLHGLTGSALWCGLALALYAIGLRYLQTGPSAEDRAMGYWPILPMFAPLLLAAVVNGPGYREPALLLCAVVALWTIYQLRKIFWETSERAYAQSGLESGLVFVDWLAVAHAPQWLSFIFIALFFTALLLQRIPPAAATARTFVAWR